VKAAAEALISNDLSGNITVFHVDNHAALKALDSTDITKTPCKETRETLNKLGRKNTIVLESYFCLLFSPHPQPSPSWQKSHLLAPYRCVKFEREKKLYFSFVEEIVYKCTSVHIITSILPKMCRYGHAKKAPKLGLLFPLQVFTRQFKFAHKNDFLLA
jgi:hypothetical protein